MMNKILKFLGIHVHEWKECDEIKKFPTDFGQLCVSCGAHRVLVRGAGADDWQIEGYVNLPDYLDNFNNENIEEEHA